MLGIDQSIDLDKDCDRMRRNQNDFHQFSWSPAFSDIIFIDESSLFAPMADFLFLNLKS